MALVPSYIQRLANYKPGKPISEAQRELGIQNFIKLASNENPLGSSPKAIEAIQNSLVNLHRYPDATGYELRTKLANRFNIKMENVVLGAGSEGIMSTIIRTFLLNDDELISASNSFIGFKVLANASGRRVHWVPMKDYRYDLTAMAEKITDYTKIIYIANPDNPMGTTITRQEFDEFYTHVPERVLIILDEAYYEFAKNSPDYPNSMSYRYDNVITLRTFSKAYGLAGARIGYGFAHESLIENLLKVKVPFEPSLSAQVAGLAALDDVKFLAKTLKINQEGMAYLKQEFDKLGIQQVSSEANFITTVWDSEETASKLTQDLLEKGVIVRQLTGFGWPNCIRISVGLDSENQKCIESLNQVL
ncbi:MAG: histidinol-phosphate transaminase [Candidatus Marinimicrobia bacterium]|jgi:histidinol-phosphate aminotransferase|nr:histidinol-phosphate transaminase [Candidatus Neomarinimicrobiota bacterium]MBT3839214.1 histidinol-phosphate transaminase [Candidatus Neomarinimicrobiota bacterium]MBT3999683.1 histidinol-phosphate transaminase [Candidatus Neomarinimicrobiota bacterium]MBT4281966.1 histidinol-phosphate transaminase [Candidatus Neomarinimicrobiota bacterium]MBT4579450.1 histidinol-phosphate transaminase [Candidatus Neomarinimicrobiota bacterium]